MHEFLFPCKTWDGYLHRYTSYNSILQEKLVCKSMVSLLFNPWKSWQTQIDNSWLPWIEVKLECCSALRRESKNCRDNSIACPMDGNHNSRERGDGWGAQRALRPDFVLSVEHTWLWSATLITVPTQSGQTCNKLTWSDSEPSVNPFYKLLTWARLQLLCSPNVW